MIIVTVQKDEQSGRISITDKRGWLTQEAKAVKTWIWNDDLHYSFCKDNYSMDSGDCVHHPGPGPHRSRCHPTVRLAHSLHCTEYRFDSQIPVPYQST